MFRREGCSNPYPPYVPPSLPLSLVGREQPGLSDGPGILQTRGHDDLHYCRNPDSHGPRVIRGFVRQCCRHLCFWYPVLVHLRQRYEASWGLRRVQQQGAALDCSEEGVTTGTPPEIRHRLLGHDDVMLAWRPDPATSRGRCDYAASPDHEKNRTQSLEVSAP